MSSDSKPGAFSNSNEPQPDPTAPSESKSGIGSGYASYPKLDPKDVSPVADTWSSTGSGSPAVPISGEFVGVTTVTPASNPYVSASSGPSSTVKNNVDKVKDALGKWGKKAAEATKRAEDLAGNMWQHLKTGPSVADAAVGKIAQSTKVLTEGGYEKVFQNTFETSTNEKLLKYYGCYLSTSTGPIVGVLYLSNEKVAFCSDNPISYKVSEEVRHTYYKVIIPLNQLKAINPSVSRANPSEKYIQIISVDNHEFWFIGFVNYDSAVKIYKVRFRRDPFDAIDHQYTFLVATIYFLVLVTLLFARLALLLEHVCIHTRLVIYLLPALILVCVNTEDVCLLMANCTGINQLNWFMSLLSSTPSWMELVPLSSNFVGLEPKLETEILLIESSLLCCLPE